jgi:hypothetical protein
MPTAKSSTPATYLSRIILFYGFRMNVPKKDYAENDGAAWQFDVHARSLWSSSVRWQICRLFRDSPVASLQGWRGVRQSIS